MFSADSLTVSVCVQCRLSYSQCLYSPSVQPRASASVPHVINPKHWDIQMAIPSFGHTKILHALVGMGGAAFGAAVSYPGKVTRISSKGQ